MPVILRIRIIGFPVFTFAFLEEHVFAQTDETDADTINDDDSEPIEGAIVRVSYTARDLALNGSSVPNSLTVVKTATTDATGKYTIEVEAVDNEISYSIKVDDIVLTYTRSVDQLDANGLPVQDGSGNTLRETETTTRVFRDQSGTADVSAKIGQTKFIEPIELTRGEEVGKLD